MQDASARITVKAANLALSALPAEELLDLRSSYAKDIASTCGVVESSVVDLQGHEATVTIAEDGSISAFVLDLSGSSANELAAKLYSTTFRSSLANSTLAFTGGASEASMRPMFMGAVTFQPEKFVPLLPTMTRTSTITSTATSTATSTSSVTGTATSTSAGISPPAGADSVDKPQDQPAGSGPAWWWFVVGSAVAGGAVAACALATQKRRQKSVDVAGSQV